MINPINNKIMNGSNQLNCISDNGSTLYNEINGWNRLKSLNICNNEMNIVISVGNINAYFISNGMKILTNDIRTNTIDVG